MAAALIGFVVEIAQGADGAPDSMLGAIAGVAKLVALAVPGFRR